MEPWVLRKLSGIRSTRGRTDCFDQRKKRGLLEGDRNYNERLAVVSKWHNPGCDRKTLLRMRRILGDGRNLWDVVLLVVFGGSLCGHRPIVDSFYRCPV